MNEAPTLLLACVAGLALGVFFFGGLWWTVRKGLSSEEPALWFFPSSMLRMGVAIAGFYVVSGLQWPRLVACLLGFVVAKRVVARLSAPNEESPRTPERQVGDAPHSR